MSELWWSMPEFLFRYRHQSLESILMITDVFFLSRYIKKDPKKFFQLHKTEWVKRFGFITKLFPNKVLCDSMRIRYKVNER